MIRGIIQIVRCALPLALALAALASCVSTPTKTPGAAATRTVYSDDGLSELIAPDSWRTRPNLTRSGTIRLADDANDRYIIVNTYLPGELEPMPFAQFAERLANGLTRRVLSGKVSGPRALTIHGRPALEYEVTGGGDVPLVYLTTMIDGEKARHQLVSWALAERYGANRAAMRELAASFRESAQARPETKRTDLTFDWPERMTATARVRSRSTKRGETIEMSMRAVSTVRPLNEAELLISGRVTDRKVTPALKDKGKADYL